ncbi:Thioredoxin domain-containing protein 17 [Cichlidogyrus casuarinus]|uniref:Thioredoxin domain-containing protein 17 n=1 Tax=Cichlidogyrus casuarinus TaxID=1844966 RepID=A0ABD2QJT2_9PLAT
MGESIPDQIICPSLEEMKRQALQGVKDGRRVILLLEGSTDESTGESWCSDCRAAEPIIEECLSKASPQVMMLFAEIGQKEDFNADNVFVKDPLIHLGKIPTMIKMALQTQELKEDSRLVEKQCCDVGQVSIFLQA